MRWLLWLGAFVLFGALGCERHPAPPKRPSPPKPRQTKKRLWTPQEALVPTAPVLIQDKGKVAPLLRALALSIEYLKKQKKGAAFAFGQHAATKAQMLATMVDLRDKLKRWGLGPRLSRYLTKEYRFFESASKDKVFFTGYYEASLRGARTQTPRYRYPLYRKPPDLYRVALRQYPLFSRFPRLPKVLRGRMLPDKRLVPYYTRAEIEDQGKLKGKGLALVWIDDPIDVAFLHIQGSGIVALPDGKTMRVNYADKNGHSYRPIGRLLLQEGHLTRKTISMQSIRAYLKANPKDQRRVLNYNPSYIFFREVKRGPLGSLGVPVTAYRSIATDRFLFPKGALCVVRVDIPTFDAAGKQRGSRQLYRLVFNQDTGGAIRSPRRVDLFTGYGASSELVAGHLKSRGRLYFLLKK